ncbi:MAG: VOC family protein [Methanobacteriota archaeon]|nr:MAG: VOC family protein [Euryarchaeota archaeon]
MAEQPKPGAIVHVEFHVKDPKKVENFYSNLFGWKFTPVPGIDYSLFEAPSGPGGGVGGLQPGNWPAGITNYILVNSVEDYQKKVQKAGGKIIVPKAEVMDQGWFAVFEDPAGNRLALWQQNPKAPQQPR